MAPQTATKLTYDDYVKLPEDGNRYEIIDGELYVNPAPVPQHQVIVLNIAAAFLNYFRAHGGGRVLGSPVDVVLSDARVVQPDVIVMKSDRAMIVGDKNVHGIPNLVVEVLSNSSRRLDEIEKRKLYDQAGVDEYWIVDPELQLVKIYRRAGNTFARAEEIDTDTGGTITTPLFAGFALPVHDVFTE